MALDSPAYDASEEDNDPLTDSGASAVSVSDVPNPARRGQGIGSRARQAGTVGGGHLGIGGGQTGGQVGSGRHALARELISVAASSDEAVDSPTYDGDVESSTTAGPDPVTPYSAIRYASHHYPNPHPHSQFQQQTGSGESASGIDGQEVKGLVGTTVPVHNHVSNATGGATMGSWAWWKYHAGWSKH